MNRLSRLFRSRPVGFIIVAACVVVVFMLMVSLLLATFFSFSSGINGVVSTQTQELSTQIVYNYENFINSFIETSNIIQTDIDRFDIGNAQGKTLSAEYLQQIVRFKSDIIVISIYDYSTKLCLTSSVDSEIGKSINDSDSGWFYEAAYNPTVHVFSTPYAEYGIEGYKVNISKRIKFQNGTREGILKIEISFQSFIDLVNKSNLGDGGHVTIVDSGYNVVYTSLPSTEALEDGITLVRDIILGSRGAVIGGNNMAVHVDTLSNTTWRICVFINTDELIEIERNFLLTMIIVAGIVLAIGIILFTVVARAITSPIKQLELAMRKVEKSDYFRTEEVELVASREVEALIGRFNKMMRKIGELMERLITEQDAQRKSELKALQNQINPHFLYNTLDSILWLIENEKNHEAEEMVVALARLFRIGISNDSETIPLRDEIEHVRNYLLIQSIRYADSFDYMFDIEPEALNVKTMKLILQPIAENCLYHGLKSKVDKGHIRIVARIENDCLCMSVSDNGYGMRQEAIDKLYQSFRDGSVSNSVGLKNIYQRVMLYYGEKAGMSIESELDEGTTISIREPAFRVES